MDTIHEQVAGVYIYLLKGAGPATVNGVLPSKLAVGQAGFEVDGVADRDYVLYDVADGTFITPRGWDADRHLKHPEDRELTTVSVDLREGVMAVSSRIGELALSTAPSDGPAIEVDIFGKQFTGIDQGDEAAAYFSDLLTPASAPARRNIRLLRADRNNQRTMSPRYWHDGFVTTLKGQDGKPFSLESLASWRELGLDDEEIIRTRPNIVIDGRALGAFGEDRIDPGSVFMIGAMGALVVGAIVRCPVPNINPATGEYDGMVSRALKGRVGESSNGDKGMFFGQALTHIWQPGQVVSVGDIVEIPVLADKPNVTLRNT